jgi:glutamine synthetase
MTRVIRFLLFLGDIMTTVYPSKTRSVLATPTLIKSWLQEQGVKYALASYVDIHGMCKAKMVPLNHLEQMLQGSELFTGAALDAIYPR